MLGVVCAPGVLMGALILAWRFCWRAGDILAQALDACRAQGKGQPQAGVLGVRLDEGRGGLLAAAGVPTRQGRIQAYAPQRGIQGGGGSGIEWTYHVSCSLMGRGKRLDGGHIARDATRYQGAAGSGKWRWQPER